MVSRVLYDGQVNQGRFPMATEMLSKIPKDRFSDFIKLLPDLILSGATKDQCLACLLEHAEWCFFTGEEEKIVTLIHTYLTQS